MGIGPVKRAVFLDRDGVLIRAFAENGRPRPPMTFEEVEILPGVPEALQALQGQGFLLIVVTNQPNVARGIQSRECVEAINASLVARLPLDDVRVCFHDDRDRCECRKPQPGLLLRAAEQYGIDLKASFMVGDRWRDVEAGHRAGCETFFIDYAYGEPMAQAPDHVVHSLAEAADWIIEHSARTRGGLAGRDDARG